VDFERARSVGGPRSLKHRSEATQERARRAVWAAERSPERAEGFRMVWTLLPLQLHRHPRSQWQFAIANYRPRQHRTERCVRLALLRFARLSRSTAELRHFVPPLHAEVATGRSTLARCARSSPCRRSDRSRTRIFPARGKDSLVVVEPCNYQQSDRSRDSRTV
jgi:hypothetical protein